MRNDEGGHLMPKRKTDWFRGIAAVMVILSHYAEWWTWFTPVEGSGAVFQLALTKLGIYGVDIFFLLSGYAMVISLGQNPMNKRFVWKRIKNTYIPYFIIIGIIELISEGFVSLQDFLYFASGYDYWYMFVLFIFYISFMLIYAIIKNKGLRVTAFCIFTYILSRILYDKGMSDFWYVSNIAFALGVIAGEYESRIKKVIYSLWIPLIVLLAAGMIPFIQWGLDGGVKFGQNPEDYQLSFQLGATVVWTLLILVLASRCSIKIWLRNFIKNLRPSTNLYPSDAEFSYKPKSIDPPANSKECPGFFPGILQRCCMIPYYIIEKIFAFLGKYSLYLYLTHTYIFMQCVNKLECSYAGRFAVSALITVAVSFLCSTIITTVCRKYF